MAEQRLMLGHLLDMYKRPIAAVALSASGCGILSRQGQTPH